MDTRTVAAVPPVIIPKAAITNINSSHSNSSSNIMGSNYKHSMTGESASAHSNNSNTTSTTTPKKPQATATPFYSQQSSHPLAPTSDMGGVSYFDTYKYKMPNKLQSQAVSAADYANYGNHFQNVAAVTYQQQQYYAAAKSQLQDATYAAATVKPTLSPLSASRQHINSYYASCNSNASNNSSAAAYYDKYEKYMYPAPTAAAASNISYLTPTPSHHAPPTHFAAEVPNSPTDTYRKTTGAWHHWNMDYSMGSCRAVPPPPPHTVGTLPTATVPPTNAAYLSSHTSAAVSRDALYTHDKYGGKYDKYNAYYPHIQQYMPPSTRNMWPTSHSQLASASLTERLPRTHQPALPPPHASHHFTSSAGTSAPQSYCVQSPYQQQQSCYYQRVPAHPTQSQLEHITATAYALPQSAATHSQQSHQYSNNGSKYGSNNDAYASSHSSGKLKNSNDLYVAASPFEGSPTNYLNFPPTVATAGAPMTANQRYDPASSSVHQSQYAMPTQALQMVDAVDIVDASSAAFYNDLNLQSTYENYATSLHQSQHVAGTTTRALHNMQPYQHHATATAPDYRGVHHSGKSLLDYRKPAAHMPMQNQNRYISQQTPTAGTVNYPNYDIAAGSVVGSSAATGSVLYSDPHNAHMENAEKSAGLTKNFNIRDFLSTWNEDEEEYAQATTAEDMNFIENKSQSLGKSVVLHRELKDAQQIHNVPSSHPNLPPQQQQQQQHQQQMPTLAENHVQMKSSFHARPKIHVGITVDSTIDMEANQYINLPDIVIDIEKSNNASGGAATNLQASQPLDTKELNFANFDVEKELDELQIKKSKVYIEKESPGESKPRETKEPNIYQKNKQNDMENMKENYLQYQSSVKNTFQDLLAKPGYEASIFGDSCALKQENPIKDSTQNIAEKMEGINTENNLNTVHRNEYDDYENTFDNPEHYLKDIEYDNNSHSNESTFEKEYETFINKIGNETDMEQATTENATQKETQAAELHDPNSNKELASISASDNEVMSTENSTDFKCADDIQSDNDREITQNIENFSKFYKKKRKLIEKSKEEEKTATSNKQQKLECSIDLNSDIESGTNFPRAYTKKCRKRREKTKTLESNVMGRIKYVKKSNTTSRKTHKPLSLYYKTLHSLRRFRFGRIKFNTSFLVQQHIAMLKERHLPLIKRQSIKKYSTTSQVYFNPKTLKLLSVSVMNTEAFRHNILKDFETSTSENLINNLVESTSESMPNDTKETEDKKNENLNEITLPSSPQEEFNEGDKHEDEHFANLQPLEESLETQNKECAVPSPHLQNASEDKPEACPLPVIDENEYSLNSPINLDESSSSSSSSTESSTSEDSDDESSRSSSSSSTESSTSQDTHDDRSISLPSRPILLAPPNNKYTEERVKIMDDDAASVTTAASNESDFNEMEALEKELSQHHLLSEESSNNITLYKTDSSFNNLNIRENLDINDDANMQFENQITNNDIADLKKILESDNEDMDYQKQKVAENTNDQIMDESNARTEMEEEQNQMATEDSAGQTKTLEVVCDLGRREDTQDLGAEIGSMNEVLTEVSTRFVPTLKTMAEDALNLYVISCNQNKSPHHYQFDVYDQVNPFTIPKLSDLCKVALNSSFESTTTTQNSSSNIIERELSVEEALAEMYRQAGVASDPEDCDVEDREAQDVLLINLEEILDSDSDLYVLQCDMNENVLSVVAHTSNEATTTANTNNNNIEDIAQNNSAAIIDLENNGERVNTLQLVEILNANDFNDANIENQLQIVNASESLIIFNENQLNLLHATTMTTTNSPEVQELKQPEEEILENVMTQSLMKMTTESAATTTTPSNLQSIICNQDSNDNSLQFDLPTIHHEEIVPDNYKKFQKEKFQKYLHEKYVLKTISKYYHSNRIVKKYKKRLIT